jgi:Tfp pilus assembly protein PilF
MLVHAQKAVAANQSELQRLSLSTRTATTGEPHVQLGRAYLGQGRYAEAIEALQAGIKKGGLENPEAARLDLGIAYLKNEQKRQAQQLFAAVERDSEWRDLAQLWRLYAAEDTAGKDRTARAD